MLNPENDTVLQMLMRITDSSVSVVAKKTGLSGPGVLSIVENSDPHSIIRKNSRSNLGKIAAYFGLTIDEIYMLHDRYQQLVKDLRNQSCTVTRKTVNGKEEFKIEFGAGYDTCYFKGVSMVATFLASKTDRTKVHRHGEIPPNGY